MRWMLVLKRALLVGERSHGEAISISMNNLRQCLESSMGFQKHLGDVLGIWRSIHQPDGRMWRDPEDTQSEYVFLISSCK